MLKDPQLPYTSSIVEETRLSILKEISKLEFIPTSSINAEFQAGWRQGKSEIISKIKDLVL